MKLQLDLKKQLAEIDENASLSEQEKLYFKRQAIDAEKDLERATGDKFDRDEAEKNKAGGARGKTNTIGAGVFSSAMGGSMLFAGMPAVPEKHLKVAEKTEKSLAETKELVGLVQKSIGELVVVMKE